ncbi:MAG: ABC transporter substrate-binding protein, partial [Raoultibacter sp.]
MKKVMISIALVLALMMQSTVFIAQAQGHNEKSVLADVEYSSIAQIENTLFFLGNNLYTYDAVGGSIVKKYKDSIQALLPGSKADDLILVNGGNELHVLDTSKGNLYRFEEKGCVLVKKFEDDIWEGAMDAYGNRRFLSPILTQENEHKMLYLLVSNKDKPTEYDLVFFDCENDEAGLVSLDNTILLSSYKDEKMVAVIARANAYRIVEIDISTHAVGSILYEEENPHYRITGMAYDQSTDKLIIVTGRGLYRIAEQKMIDLSAYLPEMDERDISADFNCFLNGKFVFINRNVFFTNNLDSENASQSLCFANNGVSNQLVRGFMLQNPDVKISFTAGMVWDIEEIVHSLLSQNSDIDIITLYSGAGFTAIKSKKYYTDLSVSKQLRDNISIMYPAICEVLMDAEEIVAYPSDMTVHCWLVDDDALQQLGFSINTASMEEWLSFAEEFALEFNADESAYALFPQGFTRKQLIREILIQYILEYESIGQLNFDDPKLADILQRILKLPESVFIKDDSEGTPIDSYDGGLPPLFTVNTLLSPDASIGFYEQYKPQYVAPPVFSMENSPVVWGMLSVYLVNPYSRNKDTAVKFLEYCSQQADPMLRFYVDRSFNQPIPVQEYVDLKQKTAAEIEELNNRLRTSSIENSAEIKTEIQKQRIVLEYAKKHEWLVSQADIASYKTVVPNVSFLSDSLCFTDSSCSVTNIGLNEMIDQMTK